MTSTPGWVTAFTACGLLCLSLLTVRVQACIVHCGQSVTRCERDCADLARRSRYLTVEFEQACSQLGVLADEPVTESVQP